MTQIITNSMPMGVPGDLSRSIFSAVTEAYNQGSTPVTGFGLPVKLQGADGVTGIVAADTSAVVLGFLVREFPVQAGVVAAEAFGVATPPLTGPVSVLKEGHIIVKNGAGTPAKEGLVYIRIATPAAGKPIGGIEAVADGANTFQLLGAAFMGAADAEGNAEVRFRIGN
jgi:hypothetical protein